MKIKLDLNIIDAGFCICLNRYCNGNIVYDIRHGCNVISILGHYTREQLSHAVKEAEALHAT
jgi:hypothetical protein